MKAKTKKSQKLKTGVKSGEGAWKLGNKSWNDDWLAPV
jgi:hypothetical protein